VTAARRLRRGEAFEKVVLCGAGGWFAQVYTGPEIDGGGPVDLVGGWYGSRAACEAIDPRAVDLYPRQLSTELDPFDLACERRWDGAS
jgi:hypothetical protein